MKLITARRMAWLGPCLALLFGGCGAGEDSPADAAMREGVLRMSAVIIRSSIPEPHRRLVDAPAYEQGARALWENLIEAEPNTGRPIPAAAESWEFSPDFRRLIIHLRPEGRWSNGDPVTAEDFLRSWRQTLRLSSDTAAPLFVIHNARRYHEGRLAVGQELGLRGLDERTVEIELEEPNPRAVVNMTDIIWAPLHHTSPAVLASAAYRESPELLVTNGAFRLKWINADGYRLEKNPHYHGRRTVRLRGIEVVYANSSVLATRQVMAGVTHYFPRAGPLWLLDKTDNGHYLVDKEPTMLVDAVSLNLRTPGPLQDRRVRRALALALHRGEALRYLDSSAPIPAGSWVPTMPGRPSRTVLREDANEARRLLAEAGYPGGRGFPVLRCLIRPSTGRPDYYWHWMEQWHRELGIKIYLVRVNPRDFAERSESRDYDLIETRWAGRRPEADSLLEVFIQPQHQALTGWSNGEISRLLAAARTAPPPERDRLLDLAEDRVLGEMPSIPLLHQCRLTIRHPAVRGLYPDVLGRLALKDVWLAPKEQGQLR